MFGYVYLTENLINHKKYIGRHKSSTFDVNYFGSGIRLKKAIKKYGIENFSCSVLCWCNTEDELIEQEKCFIKKHNATADSDYYNISPGGEAFTGGLHYMYNLKTDDLILVDYIQRDHYFSLGYIDGMRPRTEEQVEHYKEAKKDCIPITDGQKTIYIKKKDLEIFEQQGFRHGRAKPTRPNQKEENRKWVNKDGKSFMVKQEDLQKYLTNGYTLGRVKFSHYNRVQPAHNKGKKAIKVNNKIKYV